MRNALVKRWKYQTLAMAAVLASALPCAAQETSIESRLPAGVLEAAESLVLNARSVDRIWPGFWSPSRPYVLLDFARPDWALLVTSHDALDGYAQVPNSELPPALRGRVYTSKRGFDGGFILAGSGPVPDERTPAPVPLVSPSLPGYTQPALILHETFHMWQRASWSDHHRRPPTDCTPQRYDGVGAQLPPGFGDSVDRELEYLARAVTAPAAELVPSVRAFLDVRLERAVQAEPLFIAVDQRQERVEGTAEFTGLAGSIAILHSDTTTAVKALQDSLVLRLGELDRRADDLQFDQTRRAAMRAYHGGAAMTFLLDRLGVDGWRTAVEQGEFPDVLLARHVGHAHYLARIDEHSRPRYC